MSIFKDKKGFTLIEVLVYLGLFLLIIGLTYPVLSIVLNNYFVARSEVDLNNEIRNIFLRFSSESLEAKRVDILTDWEIVFEKKNGQNIYFLTKPIYLDFKTNKVKGYANNLSVGSISFSGDLYSVNFSSSTNCAIAGNTTVTSTYYFSGYAWSPNIGWIKFRNTDSGEAVYGVCEDTNKELRGFAYNDVVGWISFNCLDLNICQNSSYKVFEKDGYLYGYAWNDSIGWLIFDGKGGRVYFANKNPQVSLVELVSNPNVFVDNLNFTKIENSIKINIKVKGPSGIYNESQSVVVLPFK
jgi:type II secretory pathway pseudopilin PulG